MQRCHIKKSHHGCNRMNLAYIQRRLLSVAETVLAIKAAQCDTIEGMAVGRLSVELHSKI